MVHTLEVDTDPATGHYKLHIDNVLAAPPAIDTSVGPPAQVHVQTPSTPSTHPHVATPTISSSPSPLNLQQQKGIRP